MSLGLVVARCRPSRGSGCEILLRGLVGRDQRAAFDRRDAVQALPQHDGGAIASTGARSHGARSGRGIRRRPPGPGDRWPARSAPRHRERSVATPGNPDEGGGADRDRRSVLKAVIREAVSNPLVEPDHLLDIVEQADEGLGRRFALAQIPILSRTASRKRGCDREASPARARRLPVRSPSRAIGVASAPRHCYKRAACAAAPIDQPPDVLVNKAVSSAITGEPGAAPGALRAALLQHLGEAGYRKGRATAVCRRRRPSSTSAARTSGRGSISRRTLPAPSSASGRNIRFPRPAPIWPRPRPALLRPTATAGRCSACGRKAPASSSRRGSRASAEPTPRPRMRRSWRFPRGRGAGRHHGSSGSPRAIRVSSRPSSTRSISRRSGAAA